MGKIITCPCCGKEILINSDGSTVFFNAKSQEYIDDLLDRIDIEFGEVKIQEKD